MSLYSPRNHRAHVSAWNRHKRDMQQRAAAITLAEVAALYAANMSDDARFDLCNAIIDLIDDGDAWAERDTLMTDLGIDEDGNPVPACQDDYGDWLYEQRRDAAFDREMEA